ncbi:NAD(P)H-dependent oxidoreductase [Candidatus Parcubacteria bacterium]|nr:NAD(P)H-dependent oxidoreductase [Patescibacteria group bacterium]MBU4309482.1 NAD(P)H-dependent oxidoreductase [Patescibacteria group bacterium]MBU4432613.1 NAD(P)H-dependent oxidoreductase [Patescibacteria group bacterium]MBU4577188.1 NAD(P)H-dependent oxidoreductase [Patescibacteria group bacterium]MCG2696836.1 NAD(P)H-dependent oxidoreductase [Candidatus Parcubacteria bacterium]
MKTLVIYYSLTNNAKFIAEEIANAIGADILVLRTKKEILKPTGFMKYFWGGRQVMMKEMPELLPLEKNPSDYDLIIIGTPVWAWTFTPPLRTFFATAKIQNKKVAIFCTHGGGMRNTLEDMKKELAGNEIVGKIDFKEPLKYDKEESGRKVREWAKNLLG